MSNKPQKPITKKKATTVKWTKNADNRLLKIENQITKIEKTLENLIKNISTQQKLPNQSRIIYSIRKKL